MKKSIKPNINITNKRYSLLKFGCHLFFLTFIFTTTIQAQSTSSVMPSKIYRGIFTKEIFDKTNTKREGREEYFFQVIAKPTSKDSLQTKGMKIYVKLIDSKITESEIESILVQKNSLLWESTIVSIQAVEKNGSLDIPDSILTSSNNRAYAQTRSGDYLVVYQINNLSKVVVSIAEPPNFRDRIDSKDSMQLHQLWDGVLLALEKQNVQFIRKNTNKKARFSYSVFDCKKCESGLRPKEFSLLFHSVYTYNKEFKDALKTQVAKFKLREFSEEITNNQVVYSICFTLPEEEGLEAVTVMIDFIKIDEQFKLTDVWSIP